MKIDRTIKTFVTCAIFFMVAGTSYAQQIYASVQQNGTKLNQLGTASVDLDENTQAAIEFVDGKAVMTIGSNRVAALPMSDGGELVIDQQTSLTNDELNKVVVSTLSSSSPYATIYSPFQLIVPSGCEAYTPTFDADKMILSFGQDTQMQDGTVAPVETALLLRGQTAVEFALSVDVSTWTGESGLAGSSLNISTPTDGTVYAFGFDKNDKSKFGLYKYVGSNLAAGRAYLHTTTASPEQSVKMVFGDETTGIDELPNAGKNNLLVRKYTDNGSVVIERAGRKYNVSGQEIR